MRKIIPCSLVFIFIFFPPLVLGALEVTLKISPVEFTLFVDGEPTFPVKTARGISYFSIAPGIKHFLIKSEGYRDYSVVKKVESKIHLDISLQRWDSQIYRKAIVPVGKQPKSIISDGESLVIPLLNDSGVCRINLKTKGSSYLDIPAKWAASKGFVEAAFLPKTGELWVSQMTTDSIHYWSWPQGEYLGRFETQGEWCKVICVDPEESRAYISNWSSKDISVIDVSTHELIHKIPLPGIPRGMVIPPDGTSLYVTLYEPGGLIKIDRKNLHVQNHYTFGFGALRHIVFHEETSRLFISDMWRGDILVLSYPQDTLIKRIYVGPKINTIDLHPFKPLLFVSSRGPNNPESYLLEGAEKGKIFVIDIDQNEVVDWQWGGDQPTGLTVDPAGKEAYLSNFLDHDIWIYSIPEEYP